MMNNTIPPAEISAIRIKSNGDSVLGKITGFRRENGHVLGRFKEQKSVLKKIFPFYKSSSKEFPLECLRILEDVKLKSAEFPVSGPSTKVKNLHQNGKNYTPVELDGIKVGNTVVWMPNNLNPPEQLYVGNVLNVFANFDLVSHQPKDYIVQIKFDSPPPTAPNFEYFQEEGTLVAFGYIPLSEIKVLGDHVVDEELSQKKNATENNQSMDQCLCGILTNDNNEMPMETDLDDISHDDESLQVQKMKQHIPCRIQGNCNSCYVDTTIYTLFGNIDIFDSLLLNVRSKDSNLKQELCHQLNLIVSILREERFVPFNDVKELRKVLTEVNADYLDRFMDAEELLLDVFELMETPNFYEFDNGAADKIHQIMRPFRVKESKLVLELSTLLVESLETCNNIKFLKMPKPALILKLPFCNGVPVYGGKYLVPNLQLDLECLLKQDDKQSTMMDLFAIICLKSDHYVSFNKIEDAWVYFDSKPVEGDPLVEILPNFAQDVEKVLMEPELLISNKTGNTLENPQHLKFMCQFAYLCFYK